MEALIVFAAKYLYLVSVVAYLIFSFALWQTNVQKFYYFFKLSFFSFLLAAVVGKLLSYIIASPRPFVSENIEPLIAHAANNGFPSAYTLITMAIAFIIFVYNKKLGAILIMVALLVGTARVQAAVIHPIDVVGATLIAISVTVFVFLLVKIHALYNDDNAY